MKKKNPTDYCIQSNVFMLARYARIVQDNGMVPIVEPEVLMDGDHSIHDCNEVTGKTLKLLEYLLIWETQSTADSAIASFKFKLTESFQKYLPSYLCNIDHFLKFL